MKRVSITVAILSVATSLLVAGGNTKEVMPAQDPIVVIPAVKPFYLGMGISAQSVREGGVSVDWDGRKEQDRLGSYSVVGGYHYNEYFAIEARYTASYTHEDVVEMKTLSLFAKPHYPVLGGISLYGLLGAGYIDITAEDYRAKDMDDTQFQWGGGISYQLVENVAIFADYTFLAKALDGTFIKASDVDIDSMNIGFNYQF